MLVGSRCYCLGLFSYSRFLFFLQSERNGRLQADASPAQVRAFDRTLGNKPQGRYRYLGLVRTKYRPYVHDHFGQDNYLFHEVIVSIRFVEFKHF
jgi:hypothetical protein